MNFKNEIIRVIFGLVGIFFLTMFNVITNYNAVIITALFITLMFLYTKICKKIYTKLLRWIINKKLYLKTQSTRTHNEYVFQLADSGIKICFTDENPNPINTHLSGISTRNPFLVEPQLLQNRVSLYHIDENEYDKIKIYHLLKIIFNSYFNYDRIVFTGGEGKIEIPIPCNCSSKCSEIAIIDKSFSKVIKSGFNLNFNWYQKI